MHILAILGLWAWLQLPIVLPPPTIISVFEYDCRLRGLSIRLSYNRAVWFDYGNCVNNLRRQGAGHWAIVQVRPHRVWVFDRQKTRGFGMFR